MTTNDDSRPRGAITLEQRIRSRQASDGALSIFNRMNEAAIRNAADAIADANPFRNFTHDELTRAVQLWCSLHPGAARSVEEETANLRARRQIEGQQIPIR